MKVNGMFGSVIVRDKHPTDLNPTPIQAMCPRRLPTLSPVAHCTILAASLKLRSLCGPGRPVETETQSTCGGSSHLVVIFVGFDVTYQWNNARGLTD